MLAELVERHFATRLTDAELAQLAILMTTRVATPGQNEPVAAVVENYVDPEDLAVVRELVADVNREYLVDLDDEGFIVRLALHVRNLVARATEGGYSRNPLTRSIKTSFPMTYEIAVFLASGLQRLRGIVVNEDEIAYIALHVGSFLERVSRREERLSCVIVCPNYYDLAHMLRLRVERSLGTEVEVRSLITRSDVDWDRLTADIVITTIDERPHADDVVVVQPFLTDHDVDAVRRAIARVRRHRRRAQIKDELLQFFDGALFFRNLHARDESAMIRLLGERMIAQGIIDEDYVDGAIERERMSSTAFTDNLAVPHAMAMSAEAHLHRDRRQRRADGVGRAARQRDRDDRVRVGRPQHLPVGLRPVRRGLRRARRGPAPDPPLHRLRRLHRGARPRHRQLTSTPVRLLEGAPGRVPPPPQRHGSRRRPFGRPPDLRARRAEDDVTLPPLDRGPASAPFRTRSLF